jgi:Sensors of blue-light using FAD
MYHLVYTSYAVEPVLEEDLIQLLKKSRAYNKQNHISGILLYLNGKFIQLLEGKKPTVLALYTIIEQDPRHKRVRVVIEGSSSHRLFKDWSMGFKKLSFEEFENLSGAHDIDVFFDKQEQAGQGNLVMTFLNLFYKKNMVDRPEFSVKGYS